MYRPPFRGDKPPMRFGGGGGGGGGFRPNNMGFRPRGDSGPSHFGGRGGGGGRGFRGGSRPQIGPIAPPRYEAPALDPYSFVPDAPLQIHGLPPPPVRPESPRRSRDRDSDRRRRSRSRSRSRSRERRRRRSRSRSRSPYRRERDEEASFPMPPHYTITLRRIPIDASQERVLEAMQREGFFPKEVRIGQDARTGAARGTGFVEFSTVEEAVNWMSHSQGRLRMDNGDVMDCDFSRERSSDRFDASPAPVFSDWICSKCGVNNFKRREQCFQCGIRKSESDAMVEEGFTEIGLVPSDTLIFRQLPRRCDVEKIKESLANISTNDPSCVSLAPSRKFAYVQMKSAAEATQTLNILTQLSKLKIDGNEIVVNYSKLPMAAILTGAKLTQNLGQLTSMHQDPNVQLIAQQAVAAAQQQRFPSSSMGGGVSDATNAAAAVAQSAMNKAQVIRQMTQQALLDQAKQQVVAQIAAASLLVPGGASSLVLQQQQLATLFQTPATSAAGAASPQERLQKYGTVQTKYGELPKYPPPDTSLYTWDDKTGYYYDPSTGLYYDGHNTRYYFNSQSQKWLFWDGALSTYLPVEEPPAEEQTEEEKEKDRERKEREDKAEAAKKTAKDMEKWARQMNKKGKAAGPPPSFGGETTPPADVVAPGRGADLAFAMLEKKGVAGLVGYDDEGDDEAASSSAAPPRSTSPKGGADGISDWDKNACLLCQRQFPNPAGLTKHNNLSSLHKTNLEERGLARAVEMEEVPTQPVIQYRDRAKERRKKFGRDESEPANRLKDRYLQSISAQDFEQPTASGLTSDNKGHALLKGMGWQEGSGLGLKGQGIVAPIESEQRQQRAGLGAAGAKSTRSAAPDPTGEGYREKLKEALRGRFYELQDQ